MHFKAGWRVSRAPLSACFTFTSRGVVAVEKSTRSSVSCNLEPILLVTARRYPEYHATIHWKHESGWSGGIGWSISNRACNSPQRFRLIWTPRGLCLYLSWDCRLSFLFFFFRCSQICIITDKQLIWIF